MKTQATQSGSIRREIPNLKESLTPKRTRPCLLILALLVLAAAPSFAQTKFPPIDSLYGTAVDDNRAGLQCNGTADPHYTLISVPAGLYPLNSNFTGGLAYTVSTFAGWWAPTAMPCNGWITAQDFGTGQAQGLPEGDYIYETKFEICCIDPTSVQVTLKMAADNDACVYVNGATQAALCTTPEVGFKTLTGSANDIVYSPTTAPFVVGTNRLDFVVHNDGARSGLLVQASGSGQRF